MIIFENCTLIDGVSDAVSGDMHILVEGNTIREVADRPISAAGARRINIAGRTLMPGLIDAHAHIYAIHLNQELTRGMPHTLMMAHAIPRARAMLERGFTTIRDVAGGDYGIKKAVLDGVIAGPRMFVSGRALSQTGGHGDHRFITEDSVPCACTSALDIMTRIADGADGVRHAAREELRKGADLIKIMVTGGVGSPHDKLENTQYDAEEIRAAVFEAEARGFYVAAHCYNSTGAKRAVENGVRTIEHGNFVDREAADLMAQKGAFMVPTLICYQESLDHADEFDLSDRVRAKLREVTRAGLSMLEICRDAGVTMGFGTDLMGELNTAQSKEFELRAEVLVPMDIIKSATSINAEIIQQTGKLGCVRPGALADLLVVDGDPVANIGLLGDPDRNMMAIMQNGKFVKNAL